jgi:hypothetical protein
VKPRSLIEQLVEIAPSEASPRAIEIDFFRRLDDTYFYKKALALQFALQQREGFEAFLSADPAGLAAGEDDLPDALATELLLARLQLTETVFAFLAASFQVRPHIVYLSEYRSRELKAAIARFVKGDARGFSGGTLGRMAEVIEAAVYANLVPADGAQAWATNLSNIQALLRLAGRDYLRARFRKPLARGLRVRLSREETAALVDGPEADAARAGIEEGVAFYQLKRRKADGYHTLCRALRESSTMADVNLVYCLTLLLRTIKETRLARLRRQTKAPVNSLASVDMAALEAAHARRSVRSRLGIAVGSDIY